MASPTRLIRRDGRSAGLEFQRSALVVRRGPDAGLRRAVDAGKLSVGTSPASDLALTDASVSRAHCEIEISEQGFLVRDLDSTNGVLVNGVRIREAWLDIGAVLSLGETEIALEGSPDRAEIRYSAADRFGAAIGASPRMREIFFLLEKAASKDVTVLLSGETGTGKGVVAEALHAESPRKERPFVVVDCGSLPENLIEAELFGHARGAFTGAIGERAGAFEEASGGTIFLDEVGELPLSQQAKLLRVLESREVKRLGENHLRPVDVRIIAATNRPLAEEVERETFRRDLFFRLSVFEVKMPPLRDRREDIGLLATQLLATLARGRVPLTLAPAALRVLEQHSWPGNVRELRNVLEKAAAFAEGDVIDPTMIAVSRLAPERQSAGEQVDATLTFAAATEHFERLYLVALLRSHQMNVTRAAEAAGIHRQTIHRLLRKHGIAIEQLREQS